MFGLLINPGPHHDESLLGYLQRLAKANGLPRKELITAFTGVAESEVSEWLQIIGAPVTWPAVAAELREPKAKGFKLWTLRHVRYCPICLDESGYWRETWTLTLVTSCSKHGIELLDRCPNCFQETDSSAMLANSCKACGALLSERKHDAAAATDAAAWLTSNFENRLYAASLADGSGLAALTCAQLHELSSRLAVRSLRAESSKPLKVASSGSLEIFGPMAIAAGEVLMNWPQGFGALLGDLKDVHSEGKRWALAQAFGPIYRDIHHDLSDPAFDFIRREFESFVQETWEAPLARRNRHLSEETIQAHRWVSVAEAAVATGLAASTVKRLYQNGEVGHREAPGMSRMYTVVDLEELRAVSLTIHGAVVMKQAARLLHICSVRVRQLAAAGIVTYFGGKPREGERWLVDSHSINELMNVALSTTSEKDLVTISYLAKHSLPKGGGLVELIQAIRAGELRAYREVESGPVAVGLWLLKAQEFSAWQQARAEASSPVFHGVSVGKAAALLGVKEECAYAFVRLGLLWSTAVEHGRRTQLVVKPQAIEKFRCGYLLGPEISVYLGMSPKESFKHLWGAGFRPIAGPTISKAPCRQYVWVRSKKMVDYLMSNAALSDDLEAASILCEPIAQPRDCRFKKVGSRYLAGSLS